MESGETAADAVSWAQAVCAFIVWQYALGDVDEVLQARDGMNGRCREDQGESR